MSKKKKSGFLLKSLTIIILVIFLPAFFLAITFVVRAMSADTSISNTSVAEPIIKSESAPVVQPIIKSVVKPVIQSTTQSAIQPNAQLITQPAVQSTIQPDVKPTTQPVNQFPAKIITNTQVVDQPSTEIITQQPVSTEPVINQECKAKNILDIVVCKNYLALPLDCNQKGSVSLEECWKDMPVAIVSETASEILPECRDQGIDNYGKCKVFMSLSSECRDQGIKAVVECNKYLAVHSDCRDKKIFDIEKCDKYMSLPADCRKKGIDDVEKCQKFIYKNTMPVECVKAGSKTQEECSQVLFVLSLPAECRDKKIINYDECNKYLSLSIECRKKGIIKKDECNKYLQANLLSQECRDKGATTKEECEKIKDVKIIIPVEPKSDNDVRCKNVNITDVVKCKEFLKITLLSQECQTAKIATEKECNEFLFKKIAPKECLAGGITNDKECEDFMFNKYSTKVQKVVETKTANEIKPIKPDDWQSKNVIKDSYLGDIVTRQTQFQNIKNNIVDLTAKSIKVKDIIEKYQVAKELIPIKGEEVGLKTIVAKDNITLDSADNLTQTAPIAFMIDSDQDGLSDDMEKRLGTNPNDEDTDKDGYADGVEINNGYNPMGVGKLKQPLAPIDQAIAGNKVLGQPKTEGKKVNNLSITKVENSKVQKVDASFYEFSGKAKANSVITLYIYSDLPMIVTVKTDEYGNWKYSFNQPLVDGKHEIYVAINDNTGKVVEKSNPLSFFVKEAKAVSVNDFVAPSSISAEDSDAKGFMAYYLIAGAIVGMGLSMFLLFVKRKSL